MKQRMYNTFLRKLKNKTIAKILSNLGYCILYVFYLIVRKSKKKNKSIYSDEYTRECRNNILKKYPVKEMSSEIVNLPYDESVDLSIIMPAYNVEKFIRESILSIIEQKTKYNYELIIVNDGATDNTDEIIKSISSDKIKYIKQENQGLSGARNTGINNAVGKYITFVDSDDVMTENSIECMMNVITSGQADIVVGSYYMFTEDGSRQNCISNYQIIDSAADKAVKNHGYAWGKVFKRDIFNNLRFPMYAWYEDTIICNVIFRMKKKVVVVNDVVYGYRINPNGISRTARSSIKALDHYWVLEDAIKQAQNNGIENDSLLYELSINHLSSLLYRRVSLLDDETIKNVFILSCELMDRIRPLGYEVEGNIIKQDIEDSFKNYNYKLWKLASFII